MSIWLWLLIAACASFAALAVAAVMLWWSVRKEAGVLVRRIGRLPWRAKGRLVWALYTDRRVPLGARAALPVVAVYLALPIDLIPDFIPVLGYLDDIALLFVVGALLTRAIPQGVLDEHLRTLEGRHEVKAPPSSGDRPSDQRPATSD